jgi:hypothetical protein
MFEWQTSTFDTGGTSRAKGTVEVKSFAGKVHLHVEHAFRKRLYPKGDISGNRFR